MIFYKSTYITDLIGETIPYAENAIAGCSFLQIQLATFTKFPETGTLTFLYNG
jgi:hypothetical protein